MSATSGYELTEPGAYLFIITVNWVANGSGGRSVILNIVREGVVVDTKTVTGSPAENGFIAQQLTRIFVSEGNEIASVQVRQSSGAALSINAGSTNMQIARLAQ